MVEENGNSVLTSEFSCRPAFFLIEIVERRNVDPVEVAGAEFLQLLAPLILIKCILHGEMLGSRFFH